MIRRLRAEMGGDQVSAGGTDRMDGADDTRTSGGGGGGGAWRRNVFNNHRQNFKNNYKTHRTVRFANGWGKVGWLTVGRW